MSPPWMMLLAGCFIGAMLAFIVMGWHRDDEEPPADRGGHVRTFVPIEKGKP